MQQGSGRLLPVLLFFCLAVITTQWQHRVGYLLTQPPSDLDPVIISHYLDTWHSWTTRQPPPSQVDETTFTQCAPNVYRALMPAIYAGVVRSPDGTTAHSLLLFLLTFLLYAALYEFGMMWFPPSPALGFVLLGIAVSINLWAVDPTGVMQGILVITCLLALTRRSILLYPAFLLLMANREDGVLILAFIIILMMLDPTQRRELLPVLVSLAAIAITYEVGARLWVGSRPRYCTALGIHSNLREIAYVLRTGNIQEPIALFFATFVPLVATAFVGWRGKSAMVRSLALTALMYLGVTLVYAYAREPHRNWQVIILLLPAAFSALTGPSIERGHHADPCRYPSHTNQG